MALWSKTSEEKVMECRYIAAVTELKRAARPEEVNIAYIHLRELGDYKDAQALVKQHKAESKEKDRQRKKAEEDYLPINGETLPAEYSGSDVTWWTAVT